MEHKIEEIVKLVQPIIVGGSGGDKTESYEVLIKGPSVKCRRPASALKAMFEKPWRESLEEMVKNPDVKEARKEKTDTDDGEKKDDKTEYHPRELFTPGTVVNTISEYRDEHVDARDALDVALGYLKDILSSGGASVEGVDMTDKMFNKLSYVDAENLLGEYVANFLLDSLFN